MHRFSFLGSKQSLGAISQIEFFKVPFKGITDVAGLLAACLVRQKCCFQIESVTKMS